MSSKTWLVVIMVAVLALVFVALTGGLTVQMQAEPESSVRSIENVEKGYNLPQTIRNNRTQNNANDEQTADEPAEDLGADDQSEEPAEDLGGEKTAKTVGSDEPAEDLGD